MKFPFRRRQRGVAFTLVELLVVMAIIAILVGTISVSVGAVIKYAKRTKSSSMATSIQTAVQNYYTEYGVYPVDPNVSGGKDISFSDGASWQTLTIALCGDINPLSPATTQNPSPDLNTRKIAFFSPSRSDLDTSAATPLGVPQNLFYTTGSTTLAQYYTIAIDTDYSGVVGDSGSLQIPLFPTTGTTWPAQTPDQVVGGVLVWCSNDQPKTPASPSIPTFWSHTY